ncbi:SH3 domain-containing protein [Bartonella sp. 220]|uniref:SH3 domain-containing protein n=1 Tax=Bartonella sp. 220B TaxID=2967260 RepID=UPI0022A92628|nr:SH3 domain-containing protein [Bartonella sp. 220B]MCZ2157692.1 SH3 domain-containing protein [Bartonella sp. 220B]
MQNSSWFQFSVRASRILIAGVFVFSSPCFLHAQTPNQNLGQNLGPSGLPLPRFASIKPTRVNVRIGPGSNYSILFTYKKQGLPIEIIQEYDQWRKIRDAEGDEGWVYQSLLSGKRTAITIPWQKDKIKRIMLRKAPADNAELVAKVEPNVIGNIRRCDGHWCELSINNNIRGWLRQSQLWGIYPDEKIKNW